MGSGATEAVREWYWDAANLAAREWGVSLDEFFSDRPNTGDSWRAREPLGFTFTRLTELTLAYQRRRRTELMQLGAVIAAGANEPKKLLEMVNPMFPGLPELKERSSGPPAALPDFPDAPGEGDFVKRWWDKQA